MQTKFCDANFRPYSPERWLTTDDVQLLPIPSTVESRNDPKLRLDTKITSNFNLRIPLISANMDTVTGANMAITMGKLGGMGILHRFYPSEQDYLTDIEKVLKEIKCVAFSIGTDLKYIDFIEKVINISKLYSNNSGPCPIIVAIDLAYGGLDKCVKMTRKIAQKFGNQIQIISGNVCTPETIQALIMAGANAVKVGVGNGSFCSTRITTGVGVPQLTAIIHARQTVNSLKTNTAIIADGGIRNSGDIVKLLAAGADCVMIGRLFAATDESPGDIIEDNQYTNAKNPKYKKYRGQSSEEFMNDIGKINIAPEGVSSYLPYQGSVIPIFNRLVGGIRSGMSYLNSYSLEELSEKSVFIEVTHNGTIEAQPHGLK